MVPLMKENRESTQIITLGSFQILPAGGSAYRISSRSHKLWSLFKYLLVNKEKGAPAEIILEQMMPEEEYEDPNNALQNMIYRLRKLLTADVSLRESGMEIRFADGCYQLHLGEGVILDADEFRRTIRQADTAKSQERWQEAMELYEKALDYYDGELLPELVAEGWVIPKRTQLGNLYRKSVLQLAQLYQQHNLYSRMIQILQKAVAIDPNEEELHIRLMESLITDGKYREAKKHYDETVRYFEIQFGISPTAEMQKIQSLLAADRPHSLDHSRKIDDALIEKAESRGAFYVEYRDFYAIYVLEKRKSERSGEQICPVMIDFAHPDNEFSSITARNHAVDDFKKQMIQTMRRGDLFTIKDKTKFLILLPDLSYEQVKEVMEREIRMFNAKGAYAGLRLDPVPCPGLDCLNCE